MPAFRALTIGAVLLGASCTAKPDIIPPSHDIYAWAVEGGTGLDCHWYYFTTSSTEIAQPHRLLHSAIPARSEWSPDGRWIAVPRYGIEILDALTLQPINQKPLHADGIDDVTWAPDSHTIAYVVSDSTAEPIPGIWTMDLQCVQRAEDCQPQARFLHLGEDPDWSPDGVNIAFAWDDSPNPHPSENRIFILPFSDPEHVVRMPATPPWCRDPDWSPDGAKLAFECSWDIYVADVAGGNPVNVTGGLHPEPDGWPPDEQPRWTPLGDRIAFLSDHSGLGLDNCLSESVANALYTMQPDGTDRRAITSLGPLEIHWFTWIP